MEYEYDWPTKLRCKNLHEHVVKIMWFRPLVTEPSEPAEWEPDIMGRTCPTCRSPVEAVSAPPPK